LFPKGNRKLVEKAACKVLGMRILETKKENGVKNHTHSCSAVLVHMDPEGESRF